MTDNEYQTITLERVERVAVLTLNRPDALNALNAALMAETVAALTELDRDPNVGAIVITGSDKAFAAGADIKEIAPKTYMDVYLNDWFAAWDRLANVRTPMIAAVAGYALGGGCELAMHCDILIAADTAKFGQPEIKLGVIPGIGGSQRLTRAIGKSQGDGPVPHRAHHGHRGSRTRRTRRADRAGRAAARCRARGRAHRRLHVVADRDDGQGSGEPFVRDHAKCRNSVRTQALPLDFRHGRPKRGHGRLRREAKAAVRQWLGPAESR